MGVYNLERLDFRVFYIIVGAIFAFSPFFLYYIGTSGNGYQNIFFSFGEESKQGGIG